MQALLELHRLQSIRHELEFPLYEETVKRWVLIDVMATRLTSDPAPAWEGERALDTNDVVETVRSPRLRRCAVREENEQERSRHVQAGPSLARSWLQRVGGRRVLRLRCAVASRAVAGGGGG